MPNAHLLTTAQKRQIKELAQNGRGYSEIVPAVGPPADYATVKAYCESIETWSWQAAKRDITSSLSQMQRAGRREERTLIARNIREKTDYLAARLRDIQRRLERVRRDAVAPTGEPE